MISSVVSCIYSPPGLGKTADLLSLYPNAHWIAYARNLKPAQHLWGFDFPESRLHPASSLKDAIPIAKKVLEAGFDLVIDDFSPMVEYSVDAYRNGTDGHAQKRDYAIYQSVGSDILHLRKLAEPTKRHVAVNAHLGQPHTNQLNGQFIRGGPRMPGQTPELWNTVFDVILQLVPDSDRGWGHPYSYKCLPKAFDYVYKDRHAIADTLEISPPNLRELLFAAGYQLPYPAGLDWLGTAVANISKHWLSLASSQALNLAGLNDVAVAGPLMAQMRMALASKYTTNVLHQNWALRDAHDRTMIALQLADKRTGPLSRYGG